MKDTRYITCTSEDNISMDFTQEFNPFLLQNVEGIYEFQQNVTMQDNSIVDGATFLGSLTKKRNIVITLAYVSDYETNRQFLYELFKPNSYGTFTYHGDNEMSIDYQVEYVTNTTTKTARIATISLLCDNPFFSDVSENVVVMAGWEGGFEFQHEFVDGGEELGTRLSEESANIYVSSGTDNIGLTIKLTAYGDVTNPSIYHTQDGTSMSFPDFSMKYGDKLIITTGIGNKHIYSVVDGVKAEVNYYLSETSEFIELHRGWNSIGYESDTGRENLEVSLSYKIQYLGA